MKKLLAPLALVALATLPLIASADEMDHMKMSAHGTIESRGGRLMSNAGGALAPSLQGKPVLVRIHADWCPACAETKDTLASIRDTFGNKISYVEFDVTNAKTAAAAQDQAQKLGLAKFFEATKAATSTVAIINPKDGAVIAELYDDTNAADYNAAIAKAETAMHER